MKFLFTYFRQKSNLRFLLPSDLIKEIASVCLVGIEVDGLPAAPDETPLTLPIVQSILSLNGLLPPGTQKLMSSLNFLKEYALAQFQKTLWYGRKPPLWVNYVIRSYFALSRHIPFSKTRFVDEPFVLVEAWIAVAQAEHEYIEQLKEKSEEGGRGAPSPSIPPPPKPTYLSDIFPIPSIPEDF